MLQVKLAKCLVELSFADKVLFANSSVEENEVAIKFARKYQQTLRFFKEENVVELFLSRIVFMEEQWEPLL